MATRNSQDNDYTIYDDPVGYIKGMFYDSPETAGGSDVSYQHSISTFLLKCLVKYYKGLEKSDNKILDYGCGPTLAYSIS